MGTVINAYDKVTPEETLQTVVVETGAVLNSRPLTSVSDVSDGFEELTPNHFFIGQHVLKTLQVYLNNTKLTIAST